MNNTFSFSEKDLTLDQHDLDYIELVLEAEKLASDAYIHIKTTYNNQYSSVKEIKKHLFKRIDEVINDTANIYIKKLHKQGFYSVTKDTFFSYAEAYSYRYYEVINNLHQELSNVSDTAIVISIYQNSNTKQALLGSLYEDILNMHHAYCECIENEQVVLSS